MGNRSQPIKKRETYYKLLNEQKPKGDNNLRLKL